MRWAASTAVLVVTVLAACGEQTVAPEAGDDRPPEAVVTWVAEIPDDIPLDKGLPRSDGDFTLQRIASEADRQVLNLCGELRLVEGSVAIGGWRASGPEYGETHQLRLYESDTAAHQAFASVVERMGTCTRDRLGTSTTLFELRDSAVDESEEGISIVETYESDGMSMLGAQFFELARVGNALLVTANSGEYSPGPILDDAIVEHARTHAAPIVEAMCVFAAEPCATEVSPSVASGTLMGFPLATRYPDTNGNDGTPVDVTEVAPVDRIEFCSGLWWSLDARVAPVDVIGATYTGEAEDFRARTLARYPEVHAAQIAVTDLLVIAQDCPEHEAGGTVQVYTVKEREAGEDAVVVTRRYRGEHGFDTGLELFDAVRVGDLLLMNQAYGEGGDSDESTRRTTERLTSQTDALVEKMRELAGRTPA
jgi:hypothetical protein